MALFGSPGQSGYAAANAFLDALARHRSAAGLCATSIAFGPIAGGGLAAERATRGERLALRGMRSLAPEAAVAQFDAILSRGIAEAAVADVDVRQWIETYPQLAGSGYFSEIDAKSAPAPQAAPPRLVAGKAAEQIDQVVRDTLAAVVRLRPDAIDGTTRLSTLGLDSLMGLELRNRLESALGTRLPVSLVWSHPDVRSLAAAIADLVHDTAPAAAAAPVVASRTSDEPIAVVGMACRFPGGVMSPADFWRLLVDGRSAIDEIPDERWTNGRRPNGSGARFAGLLRDVDRFDAEFFGIAPREAASMDPQQRLLLEVAWEGLEHAGQQTSRLQESACGVFVGMMANDYRDLLLGAGTERAIADGRHGLLVVAGGGPSGVPQPAGRRERFRPRLRRESHPLAGVHVDADGAQHSRAGRPLQSVRRAGERLRAR
jgi:acyl carrier protein